MQVSRDENRVPAILGVLDSDGVTPQKVYANPTTHRLQCGDGTSGSDIGNADAVRDENRVTATLAVSLSDGVTPVPLYVDSLYYLLIQST